MEQAPVDQAEVLAQVRRHWPGHAVDRLEPVGPGGRHWRADAGWRPVMHVTHHRVDPAQHAALEAALASAAELAFALDAVVAGRAAAGGTWSVPNPGGGALSVTPWVHGEPVGAELTREEAETTARILARLHAARPPAGLPHWRPSPGCAAASERPSVAAYGAPEASAAPARPWVATHGAPHGGHQLRTPVRTLLTGWAGLRLAPPERDLAVLVAAGHADLVPDDADAALLERFAAGWSAAEPAEEGR